MPERLWKVGELAARTGLTVRTLHHYDAIGLLSPSGRTGSAHGSGHRLYTAADVTRLHQILCLKHLGFGLEQVREYMTRADYDPRAVVRLHLTKVRRQAAELAELGDRLEALANSLDAADNASPDTFLETIEVMTMIEKYYTPDQLKQIEDRRNAGGPEMDEAIQKGPQMFLPSLFATIHRSGSATELFSGGAALAEHEAQEGQTNQRQAGRGHDGRSGSEVGSDSRLNGGYGCIH